MKVLIACEESQEVCKAFRAKGHEAYSCDIQECSGGHPEWHIQGDAIEEAYSGKYDLMIAHPPCTHLAVSGARHFKNKVVQQAEALEFVKKLMNANIPRIVIENPVSVISTKIRKPDQIIQPWQFGHSEIKTTCLWLKNVPPLIYSDVVDKGISRIHKKSALNGKGSSKERQKYRSKTYPGIAKAMAEQWG
jgi:hypothetical protein